MTRRVSRRPEEGRPDRPADAPEQAGQALPLPHERDERAAPTESQPDLMMQRAKEDLDAGRVDTDLRSTPGVDAAQRKRLLKRAFKPKE